MRNNKGFSLMEIMTVIGIIAVLAAIAAPNYIRWRNNSQLSRATQGLYSDFQNAKIQSARRNAVCTIIFNAGNYTVFVDSNQDLTLDGGEPVIRTVNWSQYPGVSINALAFVNPANAIAFAPNGFCLDKDGNLTAGSVTLRNSNRQTSVNITTTGSVSINQLG